MKKKPNLRERTEYTQKRIRIYINEVLKLALFIVCCFVVVVFFVLFWRGINLLKFIFRCLVGFRRSRCSHTVYRQEVTTKKVYIYSFTWLVARIVFFCFFISFCVDRLVYALVVLPVQLWLVFFFLSFDRSQWEIAIRFSVFLVLFDNVDLRCLALLWAYKVHSVACMHY